MNIFFFLFRKKNHTLFATLIAIPPEGGCLNFLVLVYVNKNTVRRQYKREHYKYVTRGLKTHAGISLTLLSFSSNS